MAKILVKAIGTDNVVKEFDVGGKTIHAQDKLFDAVLFKTDLDRFYVTMDCEENDKRN